MATKTISIDLSAYERLTRARSSQRESFSKVIKRAVWPKARITGRVLLETLETMPHASAKVIAALEENQDGDKPPRDKWD